MIAPKRVQQAYDHRLRQFVCATGDTAHATRIGVPRSTANGWLQPRERPVISLSQFGQHVESLENELTKLRAQTAKLRHLLRPEPGVPLHRASTRRASTVNAAHCRTFGIGDTTISAVRDCSTASRKRDH